MTDILYLFADTNLFIQCRALAELDWSAWKSFDEVHVIVSRPVQREIDYRKNKGGDRVGDRSRATNKMFRQLIRSDKDHIVIRVADPCVKLYIKPEYNPDPEFAERLDYSERDDQIIGTISTFKKERPAADVRLLTDDGTPMATAKSLNIAIAEIPDAWLLPPETTEVEKKLSTAHAELARLKKAEPQFGVDCLDATGTSVKKLEYALERFDALTEAQLTDLMLRITNRFPIATDFGPREAAERQPSGIWAGLFAVKQVFVPATDNEIESYREKYPQWLKSCADILRNYHLTLYHQFGPPAFSFVAVNEGVRPGKDALITIAAKGDFLIMPPRPEANDDEGGEDKDARQKSRLVQLPRPPTPPQGKWCNEPMTAFRALHDTLAGIGSLGGGHHNIGLLNRALLPAYHNIKPFRRDPNSFYYKPKRPMQPGSSFSLECEQWRHGTENQEFPGEIHFAPDEASVAGALECTIHAENLSESKKLRIPVQITVTSVSVIDRADMLVQALTDSYSPQAS